MGFIANWKKRREERNKRIKRLNAEYDKHDTIVCKFMRNAMRRHKTGNFLIISLALIGFAGIILGLVITYAGFGIVIENLAENYVGVAPEVVDDMIETAIPPDISMVFYVLLTLGVAIVIMSLIHMYFDDKQFKELVKEIEAMEKKRKPRR